MKNLKLFFSLLLTIVSTQAVFAQTGNRIDSLKLYPTNPTSNDSVWVIAYTTFMSGSCSLDHYNLNIDNGTIMVTTNYMVGDYQAICHSEDTLFLGLLSPDDYEVGIALTKNLEQTIYDTDSLNFKIGVTYIEDKIFNQQINLYPNPTQDEIQLDTKLKVEEVSIIDLNGKQVFSETLSANKTINISHLPKSIYFLEVDVEGEMVRKKIVKE